MATIFPTGLTKAKVSTLVKLVKVRQNQSINKFFHQYISQCSSFENSNDYHSKHDGIRDTISKTRTLEKTRLPLSSFIYTLQRHISTPATYKMELFVTIVIASSH